MNSSEIRKAFLDYFKAQGHTVVSSAALIPENDPTLLFTNAGMVQFKDTFLQLDPRSYTRATSSQRCLRAGGKHNDLENVGYTARHHTFFEMLGNFSFGDYFKREAILFAWEFLTQVLGLPEDRLWITVYEEDDETADIWLKEMKVSPKRFSRCGKKDNFWSMGDTGPCGPCSEIFYDHGAHIPGGPPGGAEADLDRYVEIWNLVFMQYDQLPNGELVKLPKPSIDTGMGLERIAAVMQGVNSNYEIDIFQALIKKAAQLTKQKDLTQASLRVIADHIRSTAFLIADGVLPSNEGRGYVLRRIIRRACRHGYTLGTQHPFFAELVPTLVLQMGAVYPELLQQQAFIMQVLQQEEVQFAHTLTQGMRLLNDVFTQLKTKIIPGDVVFRLYDTYGFPADLTADIARERGFAIDEAGFTDAMHVQRVRSQEASQFGADYHRRLAIDIQSEFIGYDQLSAAVTVQGIYQNGEAVRTLHAGEAGFLVFTQTPFYAESGGQVGDVGFLQKDNHIFRVSDVHKHQHAFLHMGVMEAGSLKVGDVLQAHVDSSQRLATARHHSATHLLHAALRKILGTHVVQKGSLVEASRLRFDFAHPKAVTAEECQAIEQLVNEKIQENLSVNTEITSMEIAQQQGAMALFGEKYGDAVRVLTMGDFSSELCGGTHVRYTGDIGYFKIISESSVAAGVRRIEAVTGMVAVNFVLQKQQEHAALCGILQTPAPELLARAQQLQQKMQQQEKQISQLKMQVLQGQKEEFLKQALQLDNGVTLLVKQLVDVDKKALRQLLDELKAPLKRAVLVLASIQDEKVLLLAGVTQDLTDRVQAGKLIQFLAGKLGGSGGGRADMAEGGGPQIAGLAPALQCVDEWVRAHTND